MVINTNRNDYKLDSPSYNKESYNNSGSNNYHHYNSQQYQQQQPDMSYNNWYTDSSTQHTLPQCDEAVPVNKEEKPACCGCLPFEPCDGSSAPADHGVYSYNNGGGHSAPHVLASYGVYGTASGADDDNGFVPRTGGGYRYHHSVVNVAGSATSTDIVRNTSSAGDSGHRTCCLPSRCATHRSCCSRQQDAAPEVSATTEGSWCSSWCRPTILLLLLALLVVVFVLIFGILLYFNCTYVTCPSACWVTLQQNGN